MSGHSKWHSIKHKKAAADAKRGKAFTRVSKEITVAAKIGGGDPDGNARLRAAIAAAKTVNMPSDTIKRAIQKGTGELPGVNYEEITYEGYGPGGVAVLLQTMTDNRNRTVSEIRHLFSKYNGNLGETGCVGWMFDRKGYMVVSGDQKSEEELLHIALEAGAEDLREDDGNFEIICAPDDFETVKESLEAKGVEFEVAEISMIPQNTVKVTDKDAKNTLKLMEMLEDHDDVQNVYANFDIDPAEMEE
ncbi:MAG: YebC/PmpR family DNA-binding transcriptional regulator [Acidobacteria bacterium]|nr:YebC/PmpR family DNA-binding transcriptional regulator [Acidobacteriota bacterium]